MTVAFVLSGGASLGAIQAGMAMALEEEGIRVIGHGSDTDIIVASARAFIHALNKLSQRREAGSGAALRGI